MKHKTLPRANQYIVMWEREKIMKILATKKVRPTITMRKVAKGNKDTIDYLSMEVDNKNE